MSGLTLYLRRIRKGIGVIIPALMLSIVLLSPGTAHASGNAQAEKEAKEALSEILDMNIHTSGDKVELAHKWFADIFGGFIYQPWKGSSGSVINDAESVTILSKAIGYTNILSLFLGLIIIFYVFIGGALNTAKEGQMLGKGWSSIWLPIRTALGFGLIMPVSGVGGGVFSVAQVFIVWLIVMGSNAATILWDKTVDNIINGEPINAPIMGVGYAPSKDMLKMLACTEMFIRHKSNGFWGANKANTTVAIIEKDNGAPTVIYGTNKRKDIKGASMDGTKLGSHIRDPHTSVVKFANNGACGGIRFKASASYIGHSQGHTSTATNNNSGYIPSSEYEKEMYGAKYANNYKKIAAREGLQKAKDIVSETVDKMMPIAIQITDEDISARRLMVASQSDEDATKADAVVYASILSQFDAVASDYSTRIVSEVHSAMTGSQAVKGMWKDEMGKGGWMAAGMWFHEIGAFTSLTHQMIDKINGSFSSTTPNICVSFSKKSKNRCNSSQEALNDSVLLVDSMVADSIQKNPNSKSVSLEDVAESSCVAGGSCKADTEVINRTSSMLAKSILGILSSNPGFDGVAGKVNPFETVSTIGHTMNSYGTKAWAMTIAYSSLRGGLNGAGDTIWASVSGASIGTGVLSGILDVLISTISSLIIILVSTGFVLAYMVPFLPVITWITMIAGYFLTVVEATIAAPLAIILMVTPEGEGISGTRLERAMQLLIMAVMKPSLMIIGLIAAITLSSVSFAMMNMFFFKAVEHVLEGGILDVLAIIVIYTTTALQLCKLLVTIMYRLPDQILEWFSSGVGRQFGESDVAGSLEGSNQQMKQGVTQAATGIQSGMNRRSSERENQRANRGVSSAPSGNGQ